MVWKKVGENMRVPIYPVFKENSQYTHCKTEKKWETLRLLLKFINKLQDVEKLLDWKKTSWPQNANEESVGGIPLAFPPFSCTSLFSKACCLYLKLHRIFHENILFSLKLSPFLWIIKTLFQVVERDALSWLPIALIFPIFSWCQYKNSFSFFSHLQRKFPGHIKS